MRRRATLLCVGLATAGSIFGAAPPAVADPCVGSDNTIILCVNPTGGTLYEDCVYVGEPPCIPVHVPGPVVYCKPTTGPLYCDQ